MFLSHKQMSLQICKNISHNTLIFSNQGISEYNYGFLCSAWVHTQLYSNHVRISGCLHFISHLILVFLQIFLSLSSSMCVCTHTHHQKCDLRSILHAVYFETPSPWVRPAVVLESIFSSKQPRNNSYLHTYS